MIRFLHSFSSKKETFETWDDIDITHKQKVMGKKDDIIGFVSGKFLINEEDKVEIYKKGTDTREKDFECHKYNAYELYLNKLKEIGLDINNLYIVDYYNENTETLEEEIENLVREKYDKERE